MSRRNLVATVIGAHAGVLSLALLFGGCAREKKEVKLTSAAPVEEFRAPEAAPESILEPKGLVEETDLLVSREPEMIPVREEATPVPSPTAEAREARGPVVPEVKTVERKEAPARPAARTHRVAPGESLWKISRIYGITVAELAGANGLRPDAGVRIGQVLAIPERAAPAGAEEAGEEAPARGSEAAAEKVGEGRRHVIQKGESLWTISKHYGVSIKSLIDANKIDTPSRIRAGQTLVIPE